MFIITYFLNCPNINVSISSIIQREKPPDDLRSLDAMRHILVADEKSLREYASFLPGQRPSVSVLT